ncbi:putative amp- ligase [Lyophyllum shimeji]|uniref:Amp- ligase n=1 Tax=Lyophyllum shimeji TaxID=47721 RepID=A0A9P3PHL6_LYOSH|nr:putative amp- ligase [Lyophyllum shimeji]
MLESHLSVLEASANLHRHSAVFKTPRLDPSNGQLQGWESITYEQFQRDVQIHARYWARALAHDGIAPRSVVGLWIGGFTYADVLHIYGISRAGYVPQLFSLRLPNPAVIYELLLRAHAKALIHDSTFASTLADCPVPTHLVISPEMTDLGGALPALAEMVEDDIAFIFHTSGSTSGSPKLVPCSYRWLDSAVHKSYQTSKPRSPQRQDITVWMGSMCHIGQSFMLIGSLQHGSCVIQPTTIGFSSEELMHMIDVGGLNKLNQFAAFLANHLRKSRSDPKLLSMLSGLDEVLYSGLPLPRDEEEWAYANGIPLRNLFGSTECGAMLLSIGGRERNAPLLRPLEGVAYTFRPIAPAPEQGHQSTARLLELVILAESRDCPDASLRHADGDFHTGDLFQEPTPGMYVFRGRDDDWIKSENSLRCDTKAIEDNARATCGNLISECVVVGSGRPSPVMFIEPAVEMDHDKLKKEIVRKTRHFHSRRYLHERITSPSLIVVVAPRTLPRTATKGNIRRKAVEEAFKEELDRIYGLQRR